MSAPNECSCGQQFLITPDKHPTGRVKKCSACFCPLCPDCLGGSWVFPELAGRVCPACLARVDSGEEVGVQGAIVEKVDGSYQSRHGG